MEEGVYMEAVGAEPIDWSKALERFRAAKAEQEEDHGREKQHDV